MGKLKRACAFTFYSLFPHTAHYGGGGDGWLDWGINKNKKLDHTVTGSASPSRAGYNAKVTTVMGSYRRPWDDGNFRLTRKGEL